MVKQLDQEDSMRLREQNYSYEKKSELIINHAIDPNKMKENDWVKIGFTQKEASSIIKFQSKTVYSNQKQGYARILPASLFERNKSSAGWEENEDGG